jgi:hypothetical protein
MDRYNHFALPIGQTTIIQQKIADVTPRLMEGTGPLVELIASAELDPMIQIAGERRLMATNLAIRMDPKAAIELADRIRALDLTKGWPKQQ